VGVSSDQVGRQKEFDEKNQLNFALLSDPGKAVAAQFGVKRFGPAPTKRATFVIGQDRRILGIVTSELDMNKHADSALELLRSQP